MADRLPERKPLRLPNFGYGTGVYFVTVCTADRAPLFRTPLPDFAYTDDGRAAVDCLLQIPAHTPAVTVEKYIIMPNHVHAILTVANASGRAASLPHIVGAWKAAVSRRLGKPVWPRGYYDHVVRDENDFLRIWKYIDDNPAKWAEDEYYRE